MIHSFHVAGFWAVVSWLAFYWMHWFMRVQAEGLDKHRWTWIQARAMRLTRYHAAEMARAGGYRLCPRCKLTPTEESMCNTCGI